MLNKFQFAAKIHSKTDEYKSWQDGFHPMILETNCLMEQTLNYVHQNLVEAGFVFEPQHYVLSSAINYCGEFGLIDVIFLK